MHAAVEISRRLSRSVGRLSFGSPVTHVYNPLTYARRPHEAFLERYARPGVEAVFLGMNPGPFGMGQTGVPFGEVELVRTWMGIEETVARPSREHPRRPVDGFGCKRSEVSGARLWGWARRRFGSADAFFERFFVWNHCPLMFLEESGRNRTPDKLPVAERELLFAPCDDSLARLVELLRPERVVGVGKFAEARARSALGDRVRVGTVLHPSPASPLANRGWEAQAEEQLRAMGVRL